MSLTVQSKPTFAHFANSEFREEENAFKFTFIPSSSLEEPIPETLNRQKTSLGLDVIRFSLHPAVLKKIQTIAKNIVFLPSTANGLTNEGEVLAYNCPIFFAAIQQLQKDKVKLCIPKEVLQTTVDLLHEHRYITATEVETLKASIRTTPSFEDFVASTQETQNVEKAILLAYCFRNTQGDGCHRDSLFWLCQAKRYLHGKSLSKCIHLDRFFFKFKTINYLDLFLREHQEIYEALLSTHIKKLSFDPYSDYSPEIVVGLGHFLSKTTSVKSVTLSSVVTSNRRKFNADTIMPIANGLSKNTSIQKLWLDETELGDAGVSNVVEEIAQNPHSKITHLSFFGCGMTDVSAYKLKILILKKKQILWVNIQGNNITPDLVQKIEGILQKRNSDYRSLLMKRNTQKFLLV